MDTDFEIFATAPPGLQDMLCAEVHALGYTHATSGPGGVTFTGDWPDVWRANLHLRGASRVLVRIGGFMAFHLAQLDKRARKFPWGDVLRADVPIAVEVSTNRKSKIYHAGAATDRIARALTESHGITVSADAALTLKARIDDNRVTFSLDTSGELLHKRGHKPAVGKAPMRETLAALMLRVCDYTPGTPLYDPMCGSGTFVLEAAERTAALAPGRSRSFAFEQLASFDAARWQMMKDTLPAPAQTPAQFYGSDRDAGAIRMSTANAERAGLADLTTFTCMDIADITAPDGPPGLVMINPPYGARIGNKKLLFSLYDTLGRTLKSQFSGWRVGLVTSEAPLAKATHLPFTSQSAPIPHGGLKVWVWQTAPLP